MPKQYEAIRDNLIKHGKSRDVAQRIAAATYNKHHGSKPPVTGKHKTKKRPNSRS